MLIIEVFFNEEPKTDRVAVVETEICLIGLIGEMDETFSVWK